MSRIDSDFYGRSREIGQIRSALDSQEPVVVRVHGMRGVGKSALVSRAVRDFAHALIRLPALPEAILRRALMEGLGRDPDGEPRSQDEGSPPPSWRELFDRAADRARVGRAPFVLVLDDAHRLTEARARFEQPLNETMERARAERRPFHVVVVGGPPEEGAADRGRGEIESLTVGPLPLRAAAPMLPGAAPREVLRAYGVLGGIPAILRNVDRSLTLETNIRKLMIEDDAPFADVPGIWLERDLQTPSRYNAIMARLAAGESDWGSIRAAVPDLTSSGQLAPYVRRLEELGLLTIRRSLDAPPGSRSRRYGLADPFLAFWYRFKLPIAWGPEYDTSPDALVRSIRPGIEAHLEEMFPTICRQHMRHDALETLGANARELGSLWAPEHEIPVAGLLSSGAAFYGACFWRGLSRGEDPLGPLDEAARETRYGFGREHRLRLLFTSHEAPRWLERAAVRRDQFLLMGPHQLVGS